MKTTFFLLSFFLLFFYINAQDIISKNDNVIALNIPDDSEVFNRNFYSYAPPSYWSNWKEVASYMGSVRYAIRAWADGNTSLFAQVRYWDSDGDLVTYSLDSNWFYFRTGNYIGTVEVRFKGVPTGSSVTGQIDP